MVSRFYDKFLARHQYFVELGEIYYLRITQAAYDVLIV